MSIDQRIRVGLRGAADRFEPEREFALDSVMERARRRRRRLPALAAIVAAAAVIAVVGLAVAIGRWWGAPPAVPAAAVPTLVGTYQVDIADGPQTREERMAGRWIVIVQADGTIALTAPPSYQGLLSGSYQATSDSVRTDLFLDQPACQAGGAIGVYAWQSSAEAVTFTLSADDCPARVIFFTAGAWERLP